MAEDNVPEELVKQRNNFGCAAVSHFSKVKHNLSKGELAGLCYEVGFDKCFELMKEREKALIDVIRELKSALADLQLGEKPLSEEYFDDVNISIMKKLINIGIEI